MPIVPSGEVVLEAGPAPRLGRDPLAPYRPGYAGPPPGIDRAPRHRKAVVWWLLGAVIAVGLAVVAFGALMGDEPEWSTAEGVVRLADEPAGYWKVVGVDDVLNVRQNPGVDALLVATLPANTDGVYATGKRVSIEGLEWKQIVLGDDVGTSWVAGAYLTPDDTRLSLATSGG